MARCAQVARLAMLALLTPTAGGQTTWYVDVNGSPPGSGTPDDPYTSIQYAIEQPTTLSGDEIQVAPGTYVENITIWKDLSVFSSDGAEATILDGNHAGSVVTFCNGTGNCQGTIGQPVLDGFTVTNGLASIGPGVCVLASTANIRNCLITQNSTPTWTGNGGGICIREANANVTHCVITDNFAEGDGGGIKVENQSNVLIERSIIAKNSALNGGGIQVLSPLGATVSVRHCTIWRNTAPNAGGVHVIVGSGSVAITNSIIWQNSGDQVFDNGPVAISYTDVMGGWPGGSGNIDADPLFWDPPLGDFYLQPASPCIDAGDPNGPGDGDGSLADMGALAFDPTHGGCIPVTYCVAKQNALGCLPEINYAGSTSQTGPDDFYVLADNIVSFQNGMMIWGVAPNSLPFEGGTLCVLPPIIRTPIQNSGGATPGQTDCSGRFRFHFSHAYAQSFFLGPGSTVYAQYWYRDPGHPDGTGTGLSDGLAFMLCP